ncbi:TPA: hypothetical protein OT524_004566 [Enterobacter hormaechei]|nr:hypothetical protein [Enterobacter hormaechei]
MEYRERREPLGLPDLLLVYHDFLLALSRRTERLIQDFNAFIQCFNGRRMAAGCHNETGSLNPFGYEKSRWLGGFGYFQILQGCSCCPCPIHPVVTGISFIFSLDHPIEGFPIPATCTPELMTFHMNLITR